MADQDALEPHLQGSVTGVARRKGFGADELARLSEAVGHDFRSGDDARLAFTHSSRVKQSGPHDHYERLEFLGDRVLGLCIAEMLFAAFPDAPEGELSVRFNTLVSGDTCTQVADALDLGRFIRTGADVKQVQAKRMRSVRADVVESLIAAIYRDGGMEAARAFVERNWRDRLHAKGAGIADSKTALQEWTHIAKGGATPRYEVIDRSGPDHAPVFTVAVKLGDETIGEGEGASKRAAEQAAAQGVLIANGVWEEREDGSIRDLSEKAV